MRNIVIIGGVAGGMSAATRARRMNEQASITVIEKGGFISFANCGLPYHIAGRIENEADLLMTTPQAAWARFRIDARVGQEVVSIDRERKRVLVRRLEGGFEYELPYDKLILAPGANAIVPPIANVRAENVFLLRTMEDTRAIRDVIAKQNPKRAAIVGGGFIGLEMAEALRDRGIEVTIIEKMPRVLPPMDPEMAGIVEQTLARHDVRVHAGNGLKALIGTEHRVSAIELEDGATVETDFVLMSIGVRPNVELAKTAGITIGASGAIAVDAQQRTNDPDVYAVGDASEVVHGVHGKTMRVPLAGPANRQGRLAGEHAATDAAAPAGKVLGTAIVQVFETSAGITGLGEKAARDAGFDVDTVYVLPKHHAGYYPGAEPMRIKLIYCRATGRLLGGQAVGGQGVDKRIDVIATVLHFGGTIDDLASLDLAYAPQFGSAKDAVHIGAMVAQNQRRGDSVAIAPSALDGQQLVDVRTPPEFAAGTLHGAINVPLDELRERAWADLDQKRPTVVFCAVGQRGYAAERVLRQMGFDDVKNLKGGYSLAMVK